MSGTVAKDTTRERRYEDIVLESPVRWPDNRRIFECTGVSGKMLVRIEIEANAVDDAVLDAIEYLHGAAQTAQGGSSQRAAFSLI